MTMGCEPWGRKERLADMRVILTFRDSPWSWVDLSPFSAVADRLAESPSGAGLTDLRFRMGRELLSIDRLFDVQFEHEEENMLVFRGDCSRAMGIGADLKKGSLWVQGDAGPGLARGMEGGCLRISGHALGDCCSCMRNGLVLVEGKAGGELGWRMRRGLILVRQMDGPIIGRDMRGGTVVVTEKLSPHVRIGPGMDRGSMILPCETEISNDFYMTEKLPSSFLKLLFSEMAKTGLPFPASWKQASFQRYRGAKSGLGKAEIFVAEKPE